MEAASPRREDTRLGESGQLCPVELESLPMESATLRRFPPLPSVVQLGLIFGLLLLAAIAWAMTGDRMAGMDAGPGTDLGGLGFWLTAWVVMMAAMMFPSIAPMVVMYARIEEGKRRKGQPTQAGATATFVGGYLLTWAAAGLIAYAIFANRAVPRPRLPGLGQRRPLRGRRGHHRGRDLPAHPAQGCLPAALPEPDDVRAHALARRVGSARCGWAWSTGAGASAAAGA